MVTCLNLASTRISASVQSTNFSDVLLYCRTKTFGTHSNRTAGLVFVEQQGVGCQISLAGRWVVSLLKAVVHGAIAVIRSRIRPLCIGPWPPGEHHRAVAIDRCIQEAVAEDRGQLTAAAGRPGGPQALARAARVVRPGDSQPLVRFDVTCQVA